MKTLYLSIILACLSLTGITQRLDKSEVEYVIFEGAGIRGVSYVGAVQELETLEITDHLKGVGGTSAGAITAMLIAAGYSGEELKQVLFDLDLGEFNDGAYLFPGGINRLSKDYGWYKTDALEEMLMDLLSRKGLDPEITFLELESKSDILFRTSTTDLVGQQAMALGSHNYPNMRVVDAVLASIAIPFYFHPIVIDSKGRRLEEAASPEHKMLVDGGILMNFPIQLFHDVDPDSRTLGVRVDTQDQFDQDSVNPDILASQDIENLSEYVTAFYVLVLEKMNRQSLTQSDWDRTVRINCGNLGPRIKSMSQQQKEELVEAGREAVELYFLEE
ncbi:MAG: patatin-like phospholipase family protein [Flavobacteriales bacterium]|nr:patatin-like phospholipase family protein [Flavobacteriales bacterium]